MDDFNIEGQNWMDNSDPFGIFASRGVAAPKIPAPSEVRREAGERTARLFANYHFLQKILDRHEDTIQKRWVKKSKKQRLAILLSAWPGMPASHRPDFAAFRKSSKSPNNAAHLRDSYIWPYINQHDLLKSKALLLLLNSRGRYHPSVFAAADADAMHLGLVSVAVVPIFLNLHLMVLNGVTNDREYGQLFHWDDHEDAFQWMQTRKQFLPGEGLLILEIQDRLLEFLVRSAQQILHEISPDALASAIYAVQPEPSLQNSTDVMGFASLTVMAEEAPYRVPAKLDLGKLECLLAARTAHAEDHIWALREDPGYFAERIDEIKDHRQEMLKDMDGNVHPTLKPPREGIFWRRILAALLVESVVQLERFSELHRQARELQKLQRQYAAKIAPLKDLPVEYLSALLKFRYFLNAAAKFALSQLKIAFAASPPMRRFFVREPPESASTSKIRSRMRPGVKEGTIFHQLIWLLRTLWEDDRDLFFLRLPAVVDELDRLLKSEAEARQFVSPYIAKMIGDLSVIGECLRQLEIYQPWANGFENAMAEHGDAIEKEISEQTRPLTRVLGYFHEDKVAPLVVLCDPSDGKFVYPIDKRPSKANNDRLRAAETHLDTFWAKVDEIMRVNAGGIVGTTLQQLLWQPRYLQRTPEWVEIEASKDRKSNPATIADAGGYKLSVTLSAIHLGQETPVTGREILAAKPIAAKTKTRPTPSTENALTDKTMNVADPLQQPLDPQPLRSVDARALKVFRILFFNPDVNTTPGEVAWLDFLHALRVTGFTAEKLLGSKWHFQPTDMTITRGIQFHEPHPHGKLSFFVARRYGRRLNRAYGWHGAMFLLETK